MSTKRALTMGPTRAKLDVLACHMRCLGGADRGAVTCCWGGWCVRHSDTNNQAVWCGLVAARTQGKTSDCHKPVSTCRHAAAPLTVRHLAHVWALHEAGGREGHASWRPHARPEAGGKLEGGHARAQALRRHELIEHGWGEPRAELAVQDEWVRVVGRGPCSKPGWEGGLWMHGYVERGRAPGECAGCEWVVEGVGWEVRLMAVRACWLAGSNALAWDGVCGFRPGQWQWHSQPLLHALRFAPTGRPPTHPALTHLRWVIEPEPASLHPDVASHQAAA